MKSCQTFFFGVASKLLEFLMMPSLCGLLLFDHWELSILKKCSQVATEASTPSVVRSCGIRVRLPRGIQESQRAQACQPHTYTPQTPRKRVRITGKETANQLQGCIAAGTPSFSWLPELLLLSPGFGFSMAHGNAASSVYAAQKKDLLVELWPGFPRTEARGLGGQGDAGEDPGWDG